MVKRCRNEILVSMLELLSESPLKKTQLMYRSNISWRTLNDALSTFLERDLVVRQTDNGSGSFYRITRKGIEVLSLQRKARESFA